MVGLFILVPGNALDLLYAMLLGGAFELREKGLEWREGEKYRLIQRLFQARTGQGAALKGNDQVNGYLLLATLLVWQQDWQHAGVALIGPIPAGLPTLGLSLSLEQLRSLLAPSLLIGFMVFLSGQSAAVTLAQRRGERINTNQELLGLGAANVASALSGGFPVTGGFARSVVNHDAGAQTPMAGVFTAIQPSDTDMGSKDPLDVKITGELYGRLEQA